MTEIKKVTEFDCFEFEQRLLNVWSANEEMATITEAYLAGADIETIIAMVEGLNEFHDARMKTVWAMFELGVSSGKIT